MSRLSPTNHIAIHQQLHHDWLEDRASFTRVSPGDQRALHDYFKPSEDLSTDELLDHRKQITAARPSLPQRAGRAYRHFLKPTYQPVPTVSTGSGRARHITVRAVLRPEPNLHKLSQALLQVARELAEAKKRQQDGDEQDRP